MDGREQANTSADYEIARGSTAGDSELETSLSATHSLHSHPHPHLVILAQELAAAPPPCYCPACVFHNLCQALEASVQDLTGLLDKAFYTSDEKLKSLPPRASIFETFLTENYLQLLGFCEAERILKFIYQKIIKLSPDDLRAVTAPFVPSSSNKDGELKIEWMLRDNSSLEFYLVSFIPLNWETFKTLTDGWYQLRCFYVHSENSPYTKDHADFQFPAPGFSEQDIEILDCQEITPSLIVPRFDLTLFGLSLINNRLNFFRSHTRAKSRFQLAHDFSLNTYSLIVFSHKTLRLLMLTIQFLWATRKLNRIYGPNDTAYGIPVRILQQLTDIDFHLNFLS